MEYTKHFLKVIGILVLSVVLIVGLVYIMLVVPYHSFVKKEFELIPLFDALNVEVESQLPPLPPGAKLNSREMDGLDKWGNLQIDFIVYAMYGRWLTLGISTNAEKLLLEDIETIFAYYRSALTTKGWLKNPRLKDGYRTEYYYRGRSCISISPDANTYTIKIWQDYQHQPFNPNLPEPFLVRLFKVAHDEAVCP